MVLSDHEKKVTAYHEAGHAVVALFTPGADPVHKVTIIPRGRALGVTMQLPLDEKHGYSKGYITGRLAVMMGGRAAEELIFNEITTGASKNLWIKLQLYIKRIVVKIILLFVKNKRVHLN